MMGINLLAPIQTLLLGHAPRTEERQSRPAPRPEYLNRQDEYFAMLEDAGATHGTPGTISTEGAREAMSRIEDWKASYAAKDAMLAALDIAVQNNHSHGLAAGVRDEISDLRDWLYYERSERR